MQTLQLQQLLQADGVQVEVEQTNAPYWPSFVANVRGVRALFRLLPYLTRVWRLCGRVSVIHLMANSGWSWQLFAAPVVWMGAVRGTPVIVNYRGGEAREYLSRSLAAVRPTLRKATRLVVPSAFLQEVFSDFGFEAQIIPNVVDLDRFAPAADAARSGGQFTLVVTRNLEAIYGIDTAIEAVRIARQGGADVRLVVAGSGPLERELKAVVESAGLVAVVEFVGRLDRDGITKLYRSADVLLNASRVDNMPNSLLEGMASGLPILSTNVGGVPHMVDHEVTALLVPPDQPELMAQAIVRLLDDPSLRNALRQNALDAVQQYSWARIGDQWVDLYKHLQVSP